MEASLPRVPPGPPWLRRPWRNASVADAPSVAAGGPFGSPGEPKGSLFQVAAFRNPSVTIRKHPTQERKRANVASFCDLRAEEPTLLDLLLHPPLLSPPMLAFIAA